MGVLTYSDNSIEGLKVLKLLNQDLEFNDLKENYTIRWGNWLEGENHGLVLNTNISIKNTLDKEVLILILSKNKIVCPRRIKPGKKTNFPIIGRKYAHRSGTDIRIIDTLDEFKTSDSDYFMDWINFQYEYRVHVMDLKVFCIEEKQNQKPIKNEIIIRSSAFGWKFRKIELNNLEIDEIQKITNISVRAIHSLGLDFGAVNIGKSDKGKFYVIDVDASPKNLNDELINLYANKLKETILNYNVYKYSNASITIGADPECLIKEKNTDKLVLASDFFKRDGAVGYDDRSIEAGKKYFPIVEIRPKHSENPIEVFKNIEVIITEMHRHIHFENIGLYAGSMPIYNYWVGGHIHFGIKPNAKLIKVLDNYLALPVMMLEKTETGRQRNNSYGILGYYRDKSHGGFEYCTLSSWIISPQIAKAILCLAKVIVQEYLNLEDELICTYSDIRAYYQVNKIYFKDCIKKIINNIRETKTYKQYENPINYIFEKILLEDEWNEKDDIKESWGFNSSDKIYKQEGICFIPKAKRKQLGLDIGHHINAKIGEKIYTLKILPKDDVSTQKNGYVSFTEDIYKIIGTSDNDNIEIWYDNKCNCYRFGPIFGILSDIINHDYGPFGYQSYYFRKIIKLAKIKGIVAYVFSIWDINWNDRTIKGYTYDFEHDIWKKNIYPIPNVIYDRGDVVCERIYGQYAVDFLIKIKENNIKLINSIECIELTNNKWDAYQLLNRSEALKEKQPFTIEYNTSKQIKEYADIYGHIYMKLKDGSKSKGIFSIQRDTKGNYCITHRNLYGYIKSFNANESTIEKMINDEIVNARYKQNDYIIQEAIKISKFKQRAFEIRVYMQKNSHDIWYRTSMIARLAGANKEFINVQEELDKKAYEVLYECFGQKAEEITNNIRKTASEVVGVLDKTGIQAGEVAIDIAIDENFKEYIIELNSKPDNLLASIGAYKIRNLAANRILEYGKNLVINDLP